MDLWRFLIKVTYMGRKQILFLEYLNTSKRVKAAFELIFHCHLVVKMWITTKGAISVNIIIKALSMRL